MARNIIGIAGRAGAGKDTAADVLVAEFGYKKVSLADPMKKFLANLFDWSYTQLWGPSEERNKPDTRYLQAVVDRVPVYLSPRKALQTLGTEWGRTLYDDIWVQYAMRQALEDPDAKVVISDVRFPNELAAIAAAGGQTWNIVRPEEDVGAVVHSPDANWRAHASESALAGHPFDAELYNGGTLQEFRVSVKTLMQFTGGALEIEQ